MRPLLCLLIAPLFAYQPFPAPYSALVEMQAEIDGHLLNYFHRMPYLSLHGVKPDRAWAGGFGNFFELKSQGDQLGMNANTGGAMIGYDRQMDNFLLGFGGAWQRSNPKWLENAGHAQSNGYFAGLYTDYYYYDFYAGAAFFGGMNFIDATEDTQAQTDLNVLDLMGQLKLAYLFGSPVAYFYPYANFDFLSLHFNGYGNALTLRSELGLGLQILDVNRDETASISPKFMIGWVNMAPLARPDWGGWNETWDLFSVEFGLKITAYGFELSLDYALELSPNDETTLYNQNAYASLGWCW